MVKAQTQRNMDKFLELFLAENRYRPTRIGVFEGKPGDMEDYWLEDGMPLGGLDIDPDGIAGPDIEIMLGNNTPDGPHMTHRISGTRFVKITLSVSGDADGLEITNSKGETTVLHFEDTAITQ